MCNAVVEEISNIEFTNNCSDETNPNIIMDSEDINSITSLNLNHEHISDITGIEYFTSLTEIYLGANQVSDLSPLSNLISLNHLELPINQISDISPLNSLTNLTYLILYDNQISDLSPLADLTDLTAFNVGKNQISDLSPLSGLTNLTSLYLNYNPLNDITPLLSLDKLEVSMESFSFSENISSVITNSENYDLPSLFLLLNDTLDVEGELAPWVVAVQGIIRYTKEAGMVEYRYQNAKLSEDGKSITIEDINEPAIVGVHIEHPEAGHILLAQLTVTYEEPVDPDDPIDPTNPTNDPAVPDTGESTQESSAAILTATLCILSGIILAAIPMTRLYLKNRE